MSSELSTEIGKQGVNPQGGNFENQYSRHELKDSTCIQNHSSQ